MSYNCIPIWQTTIPEDPFDYKLRTPQEVSDEHKHFPPDFTVEMIYKKYNLGDTSFNNLDTRERIVIFLRGFWINIG